MSRGFIKISLGPRCVTAESLQPESCINFWKPSLLLPHLYQIIDIIYGKMILFMNFFVFLQLN